MLVGQGYKFTKGQHDYKTSTETTYKGRGQTMNIGKFNKNFRDGKLKCFNCNKYRHMAKECRLKKEDKQQCFKYDKERHIAKDYRETQAMKKCKVQEE